MDFKAVLNKILTGLKKFWQWLKPYLIRFHHWRKKIWKKYHVNKIILLLGLVAILISSIYLYILAKSVKVGTLEDSLKQVTIVYDKDGDEAGSLSATYGQKGNYTELDQISPYIQDAVISTEDRNFYSHKGFDIKGIGRAAVGMITSGGITGGGSTITQQLAKNAFLTLDQTFTRKAKELFMAIEIEKKYSKDEILEMYLNNSYLGSGVWGMQDAAQKYFGCNASEVTLGEAATLVGILKGPSIYNPIDYPENATKRRDTVLSVMVENGKITQEQADAESSIDITVLLNDNYVPSEDTYKFPYYFDAVIDEAVNRYNISESDLLNKGYKIYTALDQNQQNAMQSSYENDYLFPENAGDGQMVQSGSVAIDPNTGGVTALVGGRGEHVFRGFNYATQTQRSPGSAIKPLSVYTAALEKGYKPDSILKDEPLSFYDVKNYDGTYSGEVPMYQALAQSLNAPAVWLLHEMGEKTGFEKAEQFGLKLSDSDVYPGLALGGLEKGVSPLTMASAYTAFANDGKKYDSHLITKIIDSSGAIIEDNTKADYTSVMTSGVADAMTSMMLGTFSNGTGISAQPYGYSMAGKTGTQEASFDATKNSDQWIVGYTPNIVIATWMGFDKTDENHYLEGSSSSGVGPFFKAQAEAILPYVKQGEFTVADAYQTGGQVVAADEVTQSEEEKTGTDSDWSDTLSGIGDKLKEVGGQIKDGYDNVKEGVMDFWGQISGN